MKKKVIYIFVIIIYIVNLSLNIYRYEYKYTSDNQNKKYNITILEKQKEDENKVTYIAKLNNDKFILNIYIKNKYDSNKDLSVDKVEEIKKYKYGDSINVNGKIVIPEILGNIGEFNYKRYLNSKEIVGNINSYNVNYVDNTGNSLIKQIYRLRENISDKIDKNLKYTNSNLLKGMLYGDTKNLDEEIESGFRNIGISHITAVSGSNLTIFLIIFNIFLNKIKLNKYIYSFIQIFLISIFCILSSLELSVLRASIMLVINVTLKLKGKTISLEKTMLITLVIMIFINPYRIFNTGMILSFLATLSIYMFYPKIYNFCESKICWNIKGKNIRNFLLNISKIISVTLSANILILPITISTFNTFSFIFVISNLFVSTLATCINILGVIAILIPKIPVLSIFLWELLNVCLEILLKIVEVLNRINLNVNIRDIPVILVIIYYIYFILVYIGYKIRGENRQFRYILKRYKRKVVYIFFSLILLCVVYINFFDSYIYYFNVGQGEMAIVKKNHTCIMIDSGATTNDTSYIFDSFAKKEGIKNIDVLVISHFHSDHVNGIKDIIQKYKVKYVMYAYPYDFQNEEYLKFLEMVENNNVKKLIVKEGDRINVSDIVIDVLNPSGEYIKVSDEMDENENANSLCININIKGKNYLFLGDSIKDSEKYILENLNEIKVSKINCIKIAHHGSNTSTSEELIEKLKPNYAVISAKKKVYNHPSKEVLKILKKYRVKTYITEKTGGIKFVGV